MTSPDLPAHNVPRRFFVVIMQPVSAASQPTSAAGSSDEYSSSGDSFQRIQREFKGFIPTDSSCKLKFNAAPLDTAQISNIVQPNSSTAELESAAILTSELESVELNPLNSKLLTGSPRPETRLRS